MCVSAEQKKRTLELLGVAIAMGFSLQREMMKEQREKSSDDLKNSAQVVAKK